MRKYESYVQLFTRVKSKISVYTRLIAHDFFIFYFIKLSRNVTSNITDIWGKLYA